MVHSDQMVISDWLRRDESGSQRMANLQLLDTPSLHLPPVSWWDGRVMYSSPLSRSQRATLAASLTWGLCSNGWPKNCAFCLQTCSCLQLSLSSESEFHVWWISSRWGWALHQDRAFYHDPLLVSHAQHVQTVQARPEPESWVLNHQGSSPMRGRHSDVSALVLGAMAIHTKRVGSCWFNGWVFFGDPYFLWNQLVDW